MTISHLYHHPSVVLDAGSRLVMDCSLSGRTVHWEGKDSGTIELADVRSSDVGLYSCCDFLAPTECSSIHLFVRGDWVSAGLISRSRYDVMMMPLTAKLTASVVTTLSNPEYRV